MLQPPGMAISARPYRASRGPKRRLEARSFFTSSRGGAWLWTPPGLILNPDPFSFTSAPKAAKISPITRTSLMPGAFSIIVSPSARRVAGKTARTAFLAPLTVTRPLSLVSPSTINIPIPLPPQL